MMADNRAVLVEAFSAIAHNLRAATNDPPLGTRKTFLLHRLPDPVADEIYRNTVATIFADGDHLPLDRAQLNLESAEFLLKQISGKP